MTSIDISHLNDHFRHYVAAARTGERLVIIDGGEELVELVPLSAERYAVNALVRSGQVRWPGGNPTGVRGMKGDGSVSDAVLKDRR
jgi:antitoxin (DNA-binding transcriptional repressor) of toxin-antitoxin stability system